MKYLLILALVSKISFTFTMNSNDDNNKRLEHRCTEAEAFPALLKWSMGIKYDVRFYSVMKLIKKQFENENDYKDFIADPFLKAMKFMPLFNKEFKEYNEAIINLDDMNYIDVASIGINGLQQKAI